MTDKPTLKDIKEPKDLFVGEATITDYGLDASHYPHPKPKNEMPKEIWASLKTTMNIVDGVFYEDEVEGFTEKYHHDSEIQKREEIIRDLVEASNNLRNCQRNYIEFSKWGNNEFDYQKEKERLGRAVGVAANKMDSTLTKHADVIKEICDDK